MDLYKIFQFEAAHYLPLLDQGHKCKQLHGHSFHFKVTVSGKLDPKLGWVMDFNEIKKAVQPVVDELDHSLLNEIPGLENPTSENLCLWIWKKLSTKLIGLKSIEIQETCTGGCIYDGK